jgi:hypothetical protein
MQSVFIAFNRNEGVGDQLLPVNTGTPDTLAYNMMGSVGKFWANVTTERAGICVGSFTAGGADLAREPLVLASGVTPPPLELMLRDDCAKLNLYLPYGVNLILPGVETAYTIYVVPDFDSTASVSPLTLRATSGGAASLDGLTPGSYHVYTFTSQIEFEYHNPAVLQQYTGQAITLAPSSSNDLILEVPEK